MGETSQLDLRILQTLRSSEVLEELKSGSIKIDAGVACVCADGQEIDFMLSAHQDTLGCRKVHHTIALNGGGILLDQAFSEEAPIIRRHIFQGLILKETSFHITSITHTQCGAAGKHGLTMVGVLERQAHGKQYIKNMGGQPERFIDEIVESLGGSGKLTFPESERVRYLVETQNPVKVLCLIQVRSGGCRRTYILHTKRFFEWRETASGQDCPALIP